MPSETFRLPSGAIFSVEWEPALPTHLEDQMRSAHRSLAQAELTPPDLAEFQSWEGFWIEASWSQDALNVLADSQDTIRALGEMLIGILLSDTFSGLNTLKFTMKGPVE